VTSFIYDPKLNFKEKKKLISGHLAMKSGIQEQKLEVKKTDFILPCGK
jgi:hypothetical protein